MRETPESKTLKLVLLGASAIPGCRLFRNNVGTFYTREGRPVKCGLGAGTSDTIGYRSLVIRAEDVGKTVLQFIAVEVKTPTGRLSKGQASFLKFINDRGGLAFTARSVESIKQILDPI